MALKIYFLKLSYIHETERTEKDGAIIAKIDFDVITTILDLYAYLYLESYLAALPGASSDNIKLEDIQLIQGSGGGNGLIAELIACTTNEELQSNNLIDAAVWSFTIENTIRGINTTGFTFNSVTGTVVDTNTTGFFAAGSTYVVLYNY